MTAAAYIPSTDDLDELRVAAEGCRGCELYANATQTVFGDGNPHARVMLVGEQPGDREDRVGKPFVGPAGRVLAEALEKAGIPREDVFVTNVVKHFRWMPKGKRRIHRKPGAEHIKACLPWLEREIGIVSPEVLVLMGATAAQAVMGPSFRLTKDRGTSLESALAPVVVATAHPSSILRAPDEQRDEQMDRFVSDLGAAVRFAASPSR